MCMDLQRYVRMCQDLRLICEEFLRFVKNCHDL